MSSPFVNIDTDPMLFLIDYQCLVCGCLLLERNGRSLCFKCLADDWTSEEKELLCYEELDWSKIAQESIME